MRLGEVFRYEVEYRLRSRSTWAYALFLFLVMFWGLAATADGSDTVKANAPRELAQGMVLFGGLFGLLVSAALYADAAIRDVAAGMDPLLYTTRLRKGEYLGGRFLATLAINALVVLAIPLGFFVATETIVEPGSVGPHRLIAYLQPLLLFMLPNLVLVGAILYTIGVLVRQVIPVYLGTAAVFISYIVAANYWLQIEHPLVSGLADPIGINALLAMTRYWTPVELANQLIGFPTILLLNRALWLTVAVAVLALLLWRFEFAYVGESGGRRKRSRGIVDAPAEARWTGTVPKIAGVFDARTRVRQMLAVARQALTEIAASRAFPVVFLGAAGLVLLWGWNVGDTAFETPTWPVTYLVVDEVLSDRAAFLPWLVIALYAGELVWRDRDVEAYEITDAAPVPTGITLLGRFLALAVIIVGLHAALMVGGILVQTLQGYYKLELGLYVRVLFGLELLDHLIFAALAMMVHVLVNQKYVGHIVVLAACAFSVVGRQMGFPDLVVYNGGPSWDYSDMNRFGPFLGPFLWFKAYWGAWALLVGVIAVLFWVRGREPGFRRRIAQAGMRLRGPTARAAGVAVVLIITLGGFVFYNTSVLNDNLSPEEAGRPKAEYERRYGRFRDALQPTIVSADLHLELHPDESAVDMRGSYWLVNGTGTAIDSIHVVIDTEVHARAISLDRPARSVVDDEETGYWILALEDALQPGDSVRLSFETEYRPRGFRSRGIPTTVVDNGTYLDRRLFPFIGYQPAGELSGAEARKRFGLEPRPSMPGPEDLDARQFDQVVRNEDSVHVEMVVGAPADQIAVVTGVLRRSWMENGRRYVHYGTDERVPFGASVFSARYAVVEDRWNDIALQIFHHPEHQYNVPRMMEALKTSLAYYTKEFGPYQFRELRVVEIPPYSINGRAMLRTIAFSEPTFITRVGGGRVDHTFFGTAHEVAHSWWGGQLRGAVVRGRAVLSEALANYSAMMVTEKALGPEETRRVYDFQMDRYLRRRAAFERDVPLLEVEDHPHISYGKGAVAMYTLREHIGEEAVHSALRRLLEKYRDAGPPYPTSHDLLAELRAVTPDSLQYLLTDLFETITLWAVETRRAVVERTESGEYEVTLEVMARKMRADSVGRETEVPMDDLVEIGVFPAGDGPNEPIYLKRHRIRSGFQTIRVIVPQKPGRAGIDPDNKLIDRDRADNVVTVRESVETAQRRKSAGP